MKAIVLTIISITLIGCSEIDNPYNWFKFDAESKSLGQPAGKDPAGNNAN